MNIYLVTYQTNYDLGATVIVAENIEEANKMIASSDYIWDGYNITLLSELNEGEYTVYEDELVKRRG